MGSFYANLTDASWWVSVVFVGLIIGVLGAYAKNWTDAVIGYFSNAWRKRVSNNKLKRQEQIERLVNDEVAQLKILAKVNYLSIRAVTNKIFSLMGMVMLTSWPVMEMRILLVVLGGLTILSLSMAIAHGSQAIKLKSLLEEAEKRSSV